MASLAQLKNPFQLEVLPHNGSVSSCVRRAPSAGSPNRFTHASTHICTASAALLPTPHHTTPPHPILHTHGPQSNPPSPGCRRLQLASLLWSFVLSSVSSVLFFSWSVVQVLDISSLSVKVFTKETVMFCSSSYCLFDAFSCSPF